MIQTSPTRSLALAIALAAPFASAQGVAWTVDDDGPADFADVQSAVAAASDGDLILVRPGGYSWFVVDGKSLTVLVDGPPQSAEVQSPFPLFFPAEPAVTVRNLSAGQAVLVRGLLATSAGINTAELVVEVEGCDGPVVFEDCDFVSGLGNGGALGARVEASASVTFVRCLIDAGGSIHDAGQDVQLKRSGLEAGASGVFLYDSTLRGGPGYDAGTVIGFSTIPGPGGDAVILTGSTLYASGAELIGGDGGSGGATLCEAGEDGGNGILYDAGSLARLADCVVTFGTGGSAAPECPIADGAMFDGPPAGVVQLAGLARSLTTSSPAIEGTTLDLAFTGEPGDLAFLVVGTEPIAGTFYPAYAAVQHVGLPFAIVGFGALGASGALAATVPVPTLAGIDFVCLTTQALFLTGAPAVFHSGPSIAVIQASGL